MQDSMLYVFNKPVFVGYSVSCTSPMPLYVHAALIQICTLYVFNLLVFPGCRDAKSSTAYLLLPKPQALCFMFSMSQYSLPKIDLYPSSRICKVA